MAGASARQLTELFPDLSITVVGIIRNDKGTFDKSIQKSSTLEGISSNEERFIPDIIDLIVCDSSFISLKKVVKPSLSFLNKSDGKIIALIKPQFEAKQKEVRRGGVIYDPIVHKRICNEISHWFSNECNMNVLGIIKSPLEGPKGNVEYLIAAENKFTENVNNDQQE